MKILLGNTGRGGEQCIFTSVVRAYRTTFPDSYIKLLTCPQYESLWSNNKDINEWKELEYGEGKTHPDPIAACRHAVEEGSDDFDIAEYASECETANQYLHSSTLERCYAAIKRRRFPFDYIERKVFIYPTDEDKKVASDFDDQHASPKMILLSPGANTAKSPLSVEGFSELARELQRVGGPRICYTRNSGRPRMPADPKIEHAYEFLDLSYGALYALSPNIEIFVGLDTATSWIVSSMKGTMVTLRGDPSFPLWNTGLEEMGYRDSMNTHELNLAYRDDKQVIKEVVSHVL